MNFIDNIKYMFEEGKKNEYISSMPLVMARPLEGTKVRFWTRFSMDLDNAKTTIDNSLVGEYKEGYFMNESDSWSENEIFSWTKLDK